MRTVLNVVWVVLAGIWLALIYAIFAALLCITIVGIPFGLALVRNAQFALWPFGRTLIRAEGHTAGHTVLNIVWILPGLLLAIGHIITAALLAITVIGIPLAIGNVKMIPVALTPFGRKIVRTGDLVHAAPGAVVIDARELEELRAAAAPAESPLVLPSTPPASPPSAPADEPPALRPPTA